MPSRPLRARTAADVAEKVTEIFQPAEQILGF